ncbi:MAG: CopD family protein [Zoogloeaceae bacterium]|jgi:putative membrane protein|nr:CopD family protein [Zoogloeaceae bacterium]
MFLFVLKALHIFFVVSWFAGLFYLPRIFVNLAMVAQESEAERARLLLMAEKLYRFMTPLGALALGLGLWLWLGYGFGGVWLHIKLLLVLLLVAYNFYCGLLLRRFQRGENQHTHFWYRVFNEAPTFILLAIILLVVLKRPF